ncbi:MAG: hypothetical protein II625_11035 [Bacilli bacterium]|nr:hypothetical protein [Bacilli bacterium]
MAGNLDKALLQMAGFEDEGDLYAKAADKWSGIETKDYLGKTGYKFQIDKDVDDDAANWGFKDSDARLNALLYAWAKDNPNEQITPELINRLRYLAGTADSMNVTGGWLTKRVYEDPHVKGLIELIKKDPVKANNIFKAQGYNSDSAIQNYFDWATQYMDSDTNSASALRNIFGRNFNKAVRAGSHELEDELNTAINTRTPEEIARNNIEADQRRVAEEEAEHKRQRRAYLNAGLSDIDDPTPRKSTFPKEWLPKK